MRAGGRAIPSAASPAAALIACVALALAPPASLYAAPKAAIATKGAVAAPAATAAPDPLEAFSRPEEVWGRGVEAVMEGAYRACFRSYFIGGRLLTLRIPFAENGERSDLADSPIPVFGGGKGPPSAIWDEVDLILATASFRSYIAALSRGSERLIAFDLGSRSWSSSADRFAIDRLKAGDYPGTPLRPVVFSSGRGASASEVYDYLYCVGGLGMDCSGFVWYALEAVGRAGGVDLSRIARRATGAPRVGSALFIGTTFFDARNSSYFEKVEDEIRNLRPCDIIVFRDDDGSTLHSAVIQSIDLQAGLVRYLQCTDEAPRPQRGVHDSLIEFDPARPEARLSDPELAWKQERAPTFEGELISAYKDDGERYRSVIAEGRGSVVRLKALKAAITKLGAAKTR